MADRKDCRWITTTNADNIYGSEIIERVRSVKKSSTHDHLKKHPHYKKSPDMLIVPFDSRNFPEIGTNVHDLRM
jgi:hypothetical protein